MFLEGVLVLEFFLSLLLLIWVIRLCWNLILTLAFWIYDSICAVLPPKARYVLALVFKWLRFIFAILITLAIVDIFF